MTETLVSCLGGRGEHDWATSKLPGREGGAIKEVGRNESHTFHLD